MNTFVTGGAGFIGSNLVDALLAEGQDVRVLDNFSTGHRRNLPTEDVEMVEGDLCAFERVSTATRGIETLFHLGEMPSVPRSIQDPLTSNAVNDEGALNVVLAARDHRVRRQVFASSSSVYGDAPGMPRLLEDQPIAPLSPCAVPKAGRGALRTRRQQRIRSGGRRASLLQRVRRAPGPEVGYAAVKPTFICLTPSRERPTTFGDGSASRDFTHVANAVDATLAASRAPEAAGRMINVAMNTTHAVGGRARRRHTIVLFRDASHVRGHGQFLFQRRRFSMNPTPHMRWVESPMLRAPTPGQRT